MNPTPVTHRLAALFALLSLCTSAAADTVIVYDASNSMWGQIEGEAKVTIARRVLGDADRWRDLYHANRDVLSDPDAIRAGQTLKVPG